MPFSILVLMVVPASFFTISVLLCVRLYGIKMMSSALFLLIQQQKQAHSIQVILICLTALANYAAIGIEQARLNEKIKEEVKRRSQLERYHSPSVISRMMNSAETDIDAQEVEASILFSDIVGFTGMSERMEPHRVGLLLNEYFGEMTDVIFHYEGTLDKFIGDAIMAVFGAPLPMEDHAVRAVKASLDMREKLKEFNKENFAQQHIEIRIGINSGRVVAGDIGSPKRIEYTVLGNTVNIAQRLEAGVAKPGQIVIGANTYELVKDHFETRELGAFSLKGLEQMTNVYEVIAEKSKDKDSEEKQA